MRPPAPARPCPSAGVQTSPNAPRVSIASVAFRISCLLMWGIPLLHRCADAVMRTELVQLAPHVRPVADRLGRGGQTLQDHLAVALGHDAPVQEDYGAHVRLAADQPAESLFQLERRVGDEVVREAIDARIAETLEPRRG